MFDAYNEPTHDVRHRIDGLEKTHWQTFKRLHVRHRIDGLEISRYLHKLVFVVRHRIDGLETARHGYAE